MKKRIVFIGCIGVFVISLIVCLFIVFNRKITISFDTSGGDTVQEIYVRKEALTNLPVPKREGYIFDGWYLDNEKMPDVVNFKSSVKLTAKWIENTNNIKENEA